MQTFKVTAYSSDTCGNREKEYEMFVSGLTLSQDVVETVFPKLVALGGFKVEPVRVMTLEEALKAAQERKHPLPKVS